MEGKSIFFFKEKTAYEIRLCLVGSEMCIREQEIANDTPYGLAAYFSTSNAERARRVGSQLRAGMVSVNSASQDYAAPFGGYKQSGNGREWGEFGFDDYLEIKGITS